MSMIKLRAGNYMVPVQLDIDGKHLYLTFGFNRALLEDVKKMAGAHWCGYDNTPRKAWRVDNCSRNWFTINFLAGTNPYAPYDEDLRPVTSNRPLFQKQLEAKAFLLQRRQCILAGEMGVGKTLDVIEAMEEIDLPAWYVGPKAGVRAVSRELIKWRSKVQPRMMTYEGLTALMKKGIEEEELPNVIVFDESQKIKTPSSQRSVAARTLTEAMREHHKDVYVFLLSGTPAPRTPVDWWHQCEIACPGFLAEGNIRLFQRRLEIVEMRDNMLTGGAYPQHLAWRDSEDICDLCGNPRDHMLHNGVLKTPFDGEEKDDVIRWTSREHDFKPCVNEVAELYERMKGLVLVQFKKDCVDLPAMTYEEVRVKPSVDVVRTANTIAKVGGLAITVIQRLRELSDGFQYAEKEEGRVQCPLCSGSGQTIQALPTDLDEVVIKSEVSEGEYQQVIGPCEHCGGKGDVPRMVRCTDMVPCPKDQVLEDELDLNEDIGRIVVWGGFTGTVDRCVEFCLKHDWTVLRLDGRGMCAFPAHHDPEELLTAMDYSSPNYEQLREKHKRIAFVGHPKAGGVAITLTAASTVVFFSNDHSGEGRLQAEARVHRAGMPNRAVRIIDILHLPTDKLVLDSLNKKRALQSLTLGEITEALETDDE